MEIKQLIPVSQNQWGEYDCPDDFYLPSPICIYCSGPPYWSQRGSEVQSRGNDYISGGQSNIFRINAETLSPQSSHEDFVRQQININ